MNINVVIPNYNGEEGLRILLPQILKLGFKNIYLLDDNSNDNSLNFSKRFSQVKIVSGRKNFGPGGNRNRILNYPTSGIIWFVDADMSLNTKSKNFFQKVLDEFRDQKVGVIGGRIFSKQGEPMFWNYGYEMNPQRDAVIPVLEKIFNKFYNDKEISDYLRKIAEFYFYNLEIKMRNNKKREVDWVAEGNFFIRSSLFKKIGGFDRKMRYHETQDLCRRIRKKENKKIIFAPYVKTSHSELDVRKGKKEKEREAAAKYFYRKHWGMSGRVYDILAKHHKELLHKLEKIS